MSVTLNLSDDEALALHKRMHYLIDDANQSDATDAEDLENIHRKLIEGSSFGGKGDG